MILDAHDLTSLGGRYMLPAIGISPCDEDVRVRVNDELQTHPYNVVWADCLMIVSDSLWSSSDNEINRK
jgi:hypothetical protein